MSAPNHQGHQVVAPAKHHGHCDEKNHRSAVHCEELVKHLRRNKVIVWNRELDAHQGCFNAADNQENEGVHDVHQAELLVIHRRQPLIHHVQRRRLC